MPLILDFQNFHETSWGVPEKILAPKNHPLPPAQNIEKSFLLRKHFGHCSLSGKNFRLLICNTKNNGSVDMFFYL